MSKQVHFSSSSELSVCLIPEDDNCTFFPVTVSLELELSLPMVPQYVALNALFNNLERVRQIASTLPKYSTDLDDIVLPLVHFISTNTYDSLSHRQKIHLVFEKASLVLQAICEELTDGDASRHHTLLRPVKELVEFGGSMCAHKQEVLGRLRDVISSARHKL